MQVSNQVKYYSVQGGKITDVYQCLSKLHSMLNLMFFAADFSREVEIQTLTFRMLVLYHVYYFFCLPALGVK